VPWLAEDGGKSIYLWYFGEAQTKDSSKAEVHNLFGTSATVNSVLCLVHSRAEDKFIILTFKYQV